MILTEKGHTKYIHKTGQVYLQDLKFKSPSPLILSFHFKENCICCFTCLLYKYDEDQLNLQGQGQRIINLVALLIKLRIKDYQKSS